MVEPSLSMSCKSTDGWLQVEYSISNGTERRVLTYDGAPGKPEQGQWPDLAQQVYVHFSPPAGVLLKRVRPSLPINTDITFAFIPPVFLLEPHQARIVGFRLPLPLIEFSQYASPTPVYPTRRIQVEQIRLVIGYFFHESGTKLKPLVTPGVYKAAGQFGAQRFIERTCNSAVQLDVRTEPDFSRR